MGSMGSMGSDVGRLTFTLDFLFVSFAFSFLDVLTCFLRCFCVARRMASRIMRGSTSTGTRCVVEVDVDVDVEVSTLRALDGAVISYTLCSKVLFLPLFFRLTVLRW